MVKKHKKQSGHDTRENTPFIGQTNQKASPPTAREIELERQLEKDTSFALS